MSDWVHVNSSIRIDHIRSRGPLDLQYELGPILNFGEKRTKEVKLPYGSEGSLKYDIIENSNKNSLDAYLVNIYGDLRERGSEYKNTIVAFFKGFLRDKMIRSAVLEIDIESDVSKTLVYRYDNDAQDLILIFEHRENHEESD